MFGSGGATTPTNPNAAALAGLRNARSQFKGGGKEWQAIQDQIMGIRNQRKINQVAPKPQPQTQPKPTQPVQQKPVQQQPAVMQPLPKPQPQQTPQPVQMNPNPQPQPQPQPQPTGAVNTGTPSVNTGTPPVNNTQEQPSTQPTQPSSSWDWDFDWSSNGSNNQDYPQWGGGYNQGGYNNDPYGWGEYDDPYGGGYGRYGGYGNQGGYGGYGQDPYGQYDPYGQDPYGQGQYDPYSQYDPYGDMYGGGYNQDQYGGYYGGGYDGQYDPYSDPYAHDQGDWWNQESSNGNQPPQQPSNTGNINTGQETGTGTEPSPTGNGTGQPDAIPSDQMPKPYWLQQVESNGRFSSWHDFAGQAPFATKSQWAGMDPTEQQGYMGMIPKYLQNDYLENMQKAWIPGVQRNRSFLM